MSAALIQSRKPSASARKWTLSCSIPEIQSFRSKNWAAPAALTTGALAAQSERRFLCLSFWQEDSTRLTSSKQWLKSLPSASISAAAFDPMANWMKPSYAACSNRYLIFKPDLQHQAPYLPPYGYTAQDWRAACQVRADRSAASSVSAIGGNRDFKSVRRGRPYPCLIRIGPYRRG